MMSDLSDLRNGLVEIIKNGSVTVFPPPIRRVWALPSPQELAVLLVDDRIAHIRVVDIKEA